MSEFGTYAEPRHCERDGCAFASSDRGDYWRHRLDHEAVEEARWEEVSTFLIGAEPHRMPSGPGAGE